MPTRHTTPAHRYGVNRLPVSGALMIRVRCPECQLAHAYPDRLAGLESPCSECGTATTVGGPDAEYVPEADSRFEPVLHPPRATGV